MNLRVTKDCLIVACPFCPAVDVSPFHVVGHKTGVKIIVEVCPVCEKKEVTLRHIMGHSNKGSTKPFLQKHRDFLSQSMKQVQKRRVTQLRRDKANAVNTEKK